MAIILHRPTTRERNSSAGASSGATASGRSVPDGASSLRSAELPYTVTEDFVLRDKAVPVWSGIKAVFGRPDHVR